jgi:hypothetical protein
MQLFEIHLARQPWLNCDDARPWLIVRVLPNGNCECFPISGVSYGGVSCFPLSTSDADFPATGLSKDCFIHDSRLYLLRPGQFLKLRGALTGSLLADSRKYAGV